MIKKSCKTCILVASQTLQCSKFLYLRRNNFFEMLIQYYSATRVNRKENNVSETN